MSDEFLWDVLPRLTPTAAYVYLALLRYPTRARYPSASELAEELSRPMVFVTRAMTELVRTGLLTAGDARAVLAPRLEKDS